MSANTISDDLPDPVDDYIRDQRERRNIPGLALGVVDGGKVLKQCGYGLADVENAVPATADTVFQIASITKQFTAVAVMLLAEEGRLSVDDPVARHLDGLPDAWQDMTVRHLLTHTSGIKSYTDVPDMVRATVGPATQQEVLQTVADVPLIFPHGERYAYNNTGYFLLGMLIEKVSGQSYGDFLRERLFDPLGMTATSVNNGRAIVPHRATGYDFDGDLIRAPYISMDWPFSAGALLSTIPDLIRWDNAVFHQKEVVQPETLAQMLAPAMLNSGEAHPYGFGWNVTPVNGHAAVSHSGGIPGFSSHAVRFPDDDLTVIVLANGMANCQRIAQGVAGLYRPELAPVDAPAIEDADPAVTARLRGLLERLLSGGTVAADEFTPEHWERISPHLERIGKRFGWLGPLGEFTPIEYREEADGLRSFRYRTVFPRGVPHAFAVTLDADGKIARHGFYEL